MNVSYLPNAWRDLKSFMRWPPSFGGLDILLFLTQESYELAINEFTNDFHPFILSPFPKEIVLYPLLPTHFKQSILLLSKSLWMYTICENQIWVVKICDRIARYLYDRSFQPYLHNNFQDRQQKIEFISLILEIG